MPTLWQMLWERKEEEIATELKFYNPAGAKVGNPVTIDTLEFENLLFTITGLVEHKRDVDGKKFPFCDYNILARPLQGEAVVRKLRMIPLEHPEGEKTHHIILLEKLDEFGAGEDFIQGLYRQEGGEEYVLYVPTAIDAEGTVEDTPYWRVNDVETEWWTDSSLLEDEDNDGTVEDSEVTRYTGRYWDFWRETQDEGGNKVLEFYIVEMDDDNSFFTIWMGQEIDAARVNIT